MPELLSQAEENYLKAIYKVSRRDGTPVSNNAISVEMQTSAASVTDMINRLSQKGLLNYQKRRGVSLTEEGYATATHLVRKHRLWETFLVDKLQFSWDEVHELAEQLEHIQSRELVNRLDEYLGFPRYDPHGDPIPDAEGLMAERQQVALSQLPVGQLAVVVGVKDHTTPFLQYLERTGLLLGVQLRVSERLDYDNSLQLVLDQGTTLLVSQKVGQNLFVQLK
ncbi:MAG: iron-dependent repressor [Bacteroidetes bacterium]|nr:MAG: iron-dependent repressor [Bacteroidota bacterium]PTM10582.1 MAG: iron-dependent repressor [Bacteroidota bacterium]